MIMMKHKRISPKEEIELAHIIQKGGEEATVAIERFLHANLKLVTYQVSKLSPSDEDQQQDMIQEGNIGLITAIKKFDPNFGCKFSTYAMWWVRQSIQRSLGRDRTIKIPTYRQEINRKIAKAYQQLGGKPEHLSQLCEYFGLSKEEVLSALHPFYCTSLDTPLVEDESKTLGDYLRSEDDVERDIIEKDLQEQVLMLLDVLEKKEKIMIEMRFGLRGQIPTSYQKIGEHLQLSRAQVCQTVSRALKKLRKRADFIK